MKIAPVGSTIAGVRGDALPDVLKALVRRRSNRQTIHLMAVMGDVISIIVSFASAASIVYSNPINSQARHILAVIVPAYLIFAVTQHAFTMQVLARARLSTVRAVGALVLAIGFIGIGAFFLQTVGSVSRGVVGIGALSGAALIVMFRSWLALYAHRLLGKVTINEVIIQDGVQVGFRPGSIVLDAARDGITLHLDDPVMLDRLGRCLHRADRVVVACPKERRASWVSALKSANVNAELIAEELNDIGAIGLAYYNGDTTLTVASAPLSLSDQIVKRCLDLILVFMALPILVPAMIVVAFAIKLDSRGPVFFRQPRVGLGNRVFYIYKFRSMRLALADVTGGQSTSRDDRRVTRVGLFIRKTSIDEVPQIINVLLGDMSLVGPRPHPLESKAEDQLFWDIDHRYWHRHAVKPGMTGLAQVRGFRGATERTTDLTNRLQADLEYVSGWSIWRDFGIMLATFRVLVHPNAY